MAAQLRRAAHTVRSAGIPAHRLWRLLEKDTGNLFITLTCADVGRIECETYQLA